MFSEWEVSLNVSEPRLSQLEQYRTTHGAQHNDDVLHVLLRGHERFAKEPIAAKDTSSALALHEHGVLRSETSPIESKLHTFHHLSLCFKYMFQIYVSNMFQISNIPAVWVLMISIGLNV